MQATIPIIVGVVAAAVVIVVVKLVFGRSKSKHPKTLLDPAVKYPLKLVDKIVSYL